MLHYLKKNLLVCVFFPLIVSSQENNFSSIDFKSPVDFKMALSGTFGELRPNHFHSGIDIKTYGATGKPLMAIADGFVSRVAVSPGGFGKAIYIEHPNGFTSVYAHCSSFSADIALWVKSEQYRLKSFQADLFPERGQFVVHQGQVIAFSGNSGSSQGPHIHFEIRKTFDQIPVNPLLFNFDVKDFIRPKIVGLKIFPGNNTSLINGKNEIVSPKLTGWGPEYRLEAGDTIALSGLFYFGINTYDLLNDAENKNGVYAVELFIDSNLVYSHSLDEFSFAESRFVNSLIDYNGFQSGKNRFQKTYIEPNNSLSVYKKVVGNGIYSFVDGQYHRLKYVVKDAGGNESVLSFLVIANPPPFVVNIPKTSENDKTLIFNWNSDNEFETDDFRIYVPQGALYDTLKFNYAVDRETVSGFYAPIHNVNKPAKPIHTWCEISIRPIEIPERLKEKALIVRMDKDLIAMGGEWNGAFLKTKIREFGNYSIAVDTTAPKILPKNIFSGKNISDQKTIQITIDDDLAGIKSYYATLNRNWLLMEWDAKSNLLIYRIDEHFVPGKNILTLEVEDGVGNVSKYEVILFR